ncbi:MAG: hypothetical protein WCY67_04525 [Acidithiobacillus sp.]
MSCESRRAQKVVLRVLLRKMALPVVMRRVRFVLLLVPLSNLVNRHNRRADNRQYGHPN